MTKIKYVGKIVGVNKRLGPGNNGTLRTTQEYKQFVKDLSNTILLAKPGKTYRKNIVVKIEMRTKHDIDNPIKPILDALEHTQIILNDRDIIGLHVHKCKQNGGISQLSITVGGDV